MPRVTQKDPPMGPPLFIRLILHASVMPRRLHGPRAPSPQEGITAPMPAC